MKLVASIFSMKSSRPILSIILLVSVCFSSAEEGESSLEKKEAIVQGHVFAWPFLKKETMQPRGGNTQGSEVHLMVGAKPAWLELQAEGLSQKEKDRFAILAMVGSYRVSFDFIEIAGFKANYTAPRPYFSWGTERVVVLEDSEDFISLQHSLVMYFRDKEGKETGPHVLKHWRQDWSYEDTDLHVYSGDNTWTQKKAENVKGCWTQAVFQVDDSPRYEVVGSWQHVDGVSTWKSRTLWRPLPRREFASRDDYQVLQGTHEITITPNGWIHTQQNEKLALLDGGQSILGKEYGINRYEEITKPELTAGDVSFSKTKSYWAEVRKKWEEVYSSSERFSLHKEIEGKKLWQLHLSYATQVEKDGWDEEEGRKHARETIEAFLIKE